MRSRPHSPRIAIVGSGFAGLGAAITLKRKGFENVTIFDRASDVGGVWRDNVYPGAACDVQSYLYSFSFAPNSQWSNTFAKQGEIHTYLRKVADDFGLAPHIRLNTPVDAAHWDSRRSVWQLDTKDGVVEAEHLIVATGALSEPVIPDLKGIEQFSGEVFHSARWDHSFDLTDKKVVVIGTGASAIQFVPAIQPKVKEIKLFQRTAPWVVPRHDRPIGETERAIMDAIPALQRARRAAIYLEREWKVVAFRNPLLMRGSERQARKHLRNQVSDPELRAKLTPDYRLGCKRVLISNDYLRSLDADNADVVTSGIREVTAEGVVDNDGVLHPADAIIFGTGFKTSNLPLTDTIEARGITMAEAFGDSQRAYLGTSVAGFPNVYLMHGPNIGLGHTSVIAMFESQINYIVETIRYADKNGVAAVEPTQHAQDQFGDLVDRLTEGSVWTSGGCDSWYLDSTGRNSNLWPGTTFDYRARSSRFRPADHVVHIAEEVFA